MFRDDGASRLVQRAQDVLVGVYLFAASAAVAFLAAVAFGFFWSTR
jgi:hypothetical protein